MPDSRTVECQDCGHEWESTAKNPRCGQSKCGRSRNVEIIDENETDDAPDNPESDESEQDDRGDAEPTASETPADETATETTPTTEPNFSFRANDAGTNDATETPDPPTTDEDDGDDDRGDGEDEEEEELPEIEPGDLAPAIDATFDILAGYRGDHWAMQGDPVETDNGVEVANESYRLAAAWTPVINLYAPYLFRQHFAVMMAATTTMSVLAPKIKKDMKLRKQEREAEDREADPTISQRTREAEDRDDEPTTPDVEREAEISEDSSFGAIPS